MGDFLVTLNGDTENEESIIYDKKFSNSLPSASNIVSRCKKKITNKKLKDKKYNIIIIIYIFFKKKSERIYG